MRPTEKIGHNVNGQLQPVRHKLSVRVQQLALRDNKRENRRLQGGSEQEVMAEPSGFSLCVSKGKL
jgi:hypothetical protein